MKPGYPGKTAGVTVDPATGDVYMVVSDQGLWKSTDKGETFERVDGKAIGGRCETGFALNFDPAGKRLACFMIYGSQRLDRRRRQDVDARGRRATSTSGRSIGPRPASASSPSATRSNGTLTCSTDAGKTWTDLGKEFVRVGALRREDPGVRQGKKGLVRSDDGGKTWADVSDVTPPGS